MSETTRGRITYEASCPECGEKRAVMRASPWQDDVCLACGATVESTTASGSVD